MQLQSPGVERRTFAPAEGTGRCRVRRARPLLGTRVEIEAAGEAPAADLHTAIDAAFAAVETVHRLMSYHDPASELSRLNRDALHAAQIVDAHTYRVLAAALHFARLGDGAFDPCVAPMLERFGYLPSLAGGTPLTDHGSAPGGWRDIELTRDCGVRFHRPLRVDLGGIAKGYAVDLAVSMLEAARIAQITVNAGGDLRVAGEGAQRVQLRHPAAPAGTCHTLELEDAAIATSASYFSRKQLAFREVSALVDPRTGEPQLGACSISVRAPDCMTADALTKLVMFAPSAVAERALDACDAHALMLIPDGHASLNRSAGAGALPRGRIPPAGDA